jgi:hypothetical protein
MKNEEELKWDPFDSLILAGSFMVGGMLAGCAAFYAADIPIRPLCVLLGAIFSTLVLMAIVAVIFELQKHMPG